MGGVTQQALTYRIDETLFIRNRFDLTVEGNGATLKAMTIGDQNRKQLWFIKNRYRYGNR